MKITQKIMTLLALVLVTSFSMSAQKSTYFNGDYEMLGGGQHLKIIANGGMFYKAVFTGDCNARTVEGQVNNDALIIPMVGGSSNNFIIISWQGKELRVDVKGQNLMRKSCGGASVEGLYKVTRSNDYRNHYNNGNKYSNYEEIKYERNYKHHVSVGDIVGSDNKWAFAELATRGFGKVKGHKSDGKHYIVWYNYDSNQCIKTISSNGKIRNVMKSTHCNK